DQKRGQVLINERGTVYGLQVYHGRKVHYGRIDLPKAREMFIREALVYGLIARDFKFIKHNLSLLEEIELMDHQSRRLDILVDETEVFKFYDQLLPEEICQTASFEHWFKQLSTEQKNQFFLDKEDLMQRQADEVS